MLNAQSLLKSLTKPLLGVLRYGLTLGLFCVIWWWDARYLNRAFDVNLGIIKAATVLVDGSGKFEAMLRAFSAEKMLLFGEGSALLWAAGRAISLVGQKVWRGWSAHAPTTHAARPAVPTIFDRSRREHS